MVGDTRDDLTPQYGRTLPPSLAARQCCADPMNKSLTSCAYAVNYAAHLGLCQFYLCWCG
jgi:hypothetical protein